ncbi:hypothetical protein EDC01DRAFT_665325 [Geopyxis carbonaria]|nr:hypothetical protein EDC01DRAFT_665325 [Geopyxis carbonaria]
MISENTSDTEHSTRSLAKRNALTEALRSNPYDPALYVNRARAHLDLGYPDLAVGDSYRAVLLVDYAHTTVVFDDDSDDEYEDDEVRHGRRVIEAMGDDEDARNSVEKAALSILAQGLMLCGAWRDAKNFAKRGLEKFNDTEVAETFNKVLLEVAVKNGTEEAPTSRVSLYPWNEYEPDRFGKETVDYLNTHMMPRASTACKVDVVDLPDLEGGKVGETVKQLGVYATRDIYAGEPFLREESALCVVVDPVGGGLCEYCGTKCFVSEAEANSRKLVLKVPQKEGDAPVEIMKEEKPVESIKAKEDLFTCPTCLDPPEDSDDEYEEEDYIIPTYCSSYCLEQAQKHYHSVFCHNPKLAQIYRTIHASPSTYGSTVYALLLLKSFALALNRKAHPLNLEETRYLYGVPPTPPGRSDSTIVWTFEDNILRPIRMLEALPGVNIFTQLDMWEPWVINTLLTKFRKICSGRLAPGTGKTEAAAAHTLFSMVNHCCEPNVEWSCQGILYFRGRGKDEGATRERKVAVRKGQELNSSYCDINLEYKERREWMMGCLGGVCVCERCVKEETEEQQGQL